MVKVLHAQYKMHLILYVLEHLQLHNALQHWLNLMALCISQQLPSGWPLLTPSSHMAFLSNFTSGWLQKDLWPHHCITFWSGVLSTKFVGHRAFLRNLTSGWPVYDLWPQQFFTLWTGVRPTKFGGHRAFLSKLTPTWPQLTPYMTFDPAMLYALVRDSSHQIWWPKCISKQFDPWLTPDDSCMTFVPVMLYTLVRGSFHQMW